MKLVIIDDETHCVEYLEALILKYYPEAQIVSTYTSSLKALDEIPKIQPDLILLDIEMPHLNGFDLLAQLSLLELPFSIVFTTAYDKYAIRAFKFGAVDYLLKPIQRQELIETLSRIERTKPHLLAAQFQLAQQVHTQNIPEKIALSTSEGLHIISIKDIIYCESEGCYTRFFTKQNGTILLSKPIKEATDLLSSHHFLRVHNSYLVNMEEVIRYIRGEGGELIVTNNNSIPVSKTKKQQVLESFQKF